MKVFDERESLEHEIIKLYEYGSTVYGTSTEKSDEDYIAIIDSEEDIAYNVRGEVDYIAYSESMFVKAIKDHKISVLECIFQNVNDKYTQHFKLNTELLRREVSSISSNSYVKCKKKLKEGETYVGLKSLFHSLRILDYGIQIANNSKIVDYTSSNNYLIDIMEIGDDWNELHRKYKPIHNELKSKFREVCPLLEEL